MSRTRVKICGITRLQDALAAIDSGADALGFNFYAASPRYLNPEQALNIIRAMPALVSKVGLFVNASATEVEQICAQVPLDYLQFHGEETADFCTAFPRPFIKALRIKPGMDIAAAIQPYHRAAAILLDAWHPQEAGGTGQSFDWSLLAQLPDEMPPLILAGGLQSSNVRAAIAQVKPFAVDVSSGVEDSPGVKSAAKLQEFMNEVQSV